MSSAAERPLPETSAVRKKKPSSSGTASQGVEVVETHACQRVREQTVTLDGVMALFAQAVCAPLHTVQRAIHFAQQPREIVTPGDGSASRLQARAAVQENSPDYVPLGCHAHIIPRLHAGELPQLFPKVRHLTLEPFHGLLKLRQGTALGRYRLRARGFRRRRGAVKQVR